MKNILLKVIALMSFAIIVSMSAMAQNDATITGPHGGQVFTWNLTTYHVEMVYNKANGTADFYVLTKDNKNASLSNAASTAQIIADYGGQRNTESIQATIKTKNKFSVIIPEKDKLNYVAATINFNGEILHARFILDEKNK